MAIIGLVNGWTAQEKSPDVPPPSSKPMIGPTWLILVVVALFIAIILPRLRRRRMPATEALGTFGSASTRGPREELERLLSEIQDLSREQIAKLDTKIRMLNQLLLECDQKKRELETLLGRAASAGLLKAEPAPAEPLLSRAESREPPSRPPNPLHDRVYSLQDSGKDLLEICGATGLEKGEVELILGLRRMPPR